MSSSWPDICNFIKAVDINELNWFYFLGAHEIIAMDIFITVLLIRKNTICIYLFICAFATLCYCRLYIKFRLKPCWTCYKVQQIKTPMWTQPLRKTHDSSILFLTFPCRVCLISFVLCYWNVFKITYFNSLNLPFPHLSPVGVVIQAEAD